MPSVPRRSIIVRLRESVWMPIGLRAAGILCGMLALAGIGAWSTLQGAGVPLALASAAGSAFHPVPVPAPSNPGITDAHATSTPSAAPPAPPAPPAPAEAPPGGVAPDGRVILNLATAEDLMRLPRVGAKRAENILRLRMKLGRFKQPADLLRVKGIGRKTLQLMIPKLMVDPPKAAAPKAEPDPAPR